MTGTRSSTLLLAALTAAAVTAATGQRARHLLPLATVPGADPAAAIEGLASLAAALLSGWLTLVLVLGLAAQLPGGPGPLCARLCQRITPVLVRQVAAVALEACVSASANAAAAPAVAVPAVSAHPNQQAPPGPGWTGARQAVDPGVPSTAADGPGWLPRRPPARHHAEAPLLAGTRPANGPREVVVHRGDTLWSIAARHLGPEATPAEIASSWPLWHEQNRERIGADPHTILPGTRLVPPERHHDPGAGPDTKGTS